ncbi:plasmid recombination protein [Bacteroides fragilis]|uniref:MobV family relaxase n=1 Tax=Bacteroides fragilis TaxID=817 RepID=UPI0020304824|nr:MobV family relaxase [Bacteroides fragilis]MCE8586455.1 plasmid recombination protein [Bacteroides fragilis]MCE8590536.1 plasmid recombination protein [Bacteroides fragilis]MCE8659109.1 plasmid recombination protein [Bacteroides fragilis]MCE8663497.1 plasmid recombination protein [Bacteroides fragilis]MCM0352043.1 plasmid recombination protein [Bacteroides fragilis]
MGYAVLHLEKAKGTDSRMCAHIERTVHPKNADRTRTHLNRELVQFPEGVRNRTQAIAHRIETAGIRRKVSANQVKAIRILLTGSNKDMKQMEAEGRIEDWCNDSLQWLRETYGEQNLVSAVLHMDEKTPHIHATVIPIVTGERRKAGQEEQNGKKKYRKKNPQDVRLCADDVMARHRLKHYQDTYAQAMNKYGLQRGVDGSLARHISTMQYYKQLVEQQDSLQENIENLLGLEEEAMKKLKQVKGEINVQKMKGAAVNATTAIADGVSSLFGGSKVKKLEAENENLKRNIVNLQKQVQAEQREQTKMENRHSSEINRVDRSYRQKIAEYDNRLELIDTYFPIVKELMPIAEQCREVGFTEELTRRIVSLQPVEFKGRLYSKEYKEKFRTEHSTATVERNPQEKGKFRLCIDGIPILDWFRKKFQEIKEKLGLNTPVENKQRKGLKI